MANNKIHTPGYLIKRLRDSGFIVIRLFDKYTVNDYRRWTINIDPGCSNILLTCYENYPCIGDISFELNDGGNLWPRNFMIKTHSVEVIILNLIEKNIPTYNKDNPFFKLRLQSIYDKK